MKRSYFQSHFVVLCIVCACSIASGDTLDPIEVVRRYPIDKNVITATAVQAGKDALEWKIEQHARTEARVAEQVERLEHQIKEHTKLIEELTERDLGMFAFTSEEVRAALVGRILEQLMEIRLDIAAYEAIVEHWEQQAEEGNSSSGRLELKFEKREAALKAELEMLATQARQLEKMRERGFVTEGEVLKTRASLREAEAKLAELELEEENATQQGVMTSLTDARVKLIEKRAREKMALEQLQGLTAASQAALRQRGLQREVDRHYALLEIHLEELHRASFERARARDLLSLIEHHQEQMVQAVEKSGEE